MKNFRFFKIVLCFVVLASEIPAEAWAKSTAQKSKNYYVSAKSAIFSNSTKRRRLYGKDVDTKVQPASTTKVMTALLVLERLPLDKVVEVRRTATLVQPSRLDLHPGEQYTVQDLLYAILLNSANDASIVLAEAVAGTEGKFVTLMNERARQLGAFHTKFSNANGLPSPKVTQHTTAFDMYLIFREALKYEFFRKAITYRYQTIYSQDGRKIPLKNHNKMLFTDWGKNISGKTGYTRAAQSCFVGYTKKNGDDLIIAVFGCTRRWNDIRQLMQKYGGIAF